MRTLTRSATPSLGRSLQARLMLLVATLLLALAPAQALAAELRQGETTVVTPGETIDDDLYAFGSSVNIHGAVKGDVIAAAGTHTISGVVTGDLMAAGGTITLTGQIDGSVRAVGGTLTIDGPVGGDVVIAGGTLTLGPNARVGRDVLVGGGSTTIGGRVGRDLIAGGESVTIAGTVGGNVRAETATLRLADGAAIAGSLAYGSRNDAEIAPRATVAGGIERYTPEWANAAPGQEPTPLEIFGAAAAGWLRAVIGLFAFGLLLVLPFPSFSRRAVGTLRTSPWPSLGLGFGLLAGVPVAALIVFVVGLMVGGWWIGLMLLGLYAIGLPLGLTTIALFVGSRVLARSGRPATHIAWALLLGLAVLTLVGTAPLVGGLVVFVALLFGLGALVLTAIRDHRGPSLPAVYSGAEQDDDRDDPILAAAR